EGWSWDEALARCNEVDHSRDRFMRYFFGAAAGRPEEYDLTVNAGRVPLEDVVACVIALARGEGEAAAPVPVVPRVLTLARELGAGATGFAPTLAGRLGLRVYDRELLEQEAARLGVSASELEAVDEQPAGLLGRLRPGGLPARYLEAMGQLMAELAARGDA